MTKHDKPKPGDKKGDRRFDDYVYRNGEGYHNYQVFDDGRIDMHWWMGDLRAIICESNALTEMHEHFSNFYLKQLREYEKRRANFWQRMIKDLQMIDPTFDKTKFTYGIDLDTGFLTRAPIKEKPEEEAPKAGDGS